MKFTLALITIEIVSVYCAVVNNGLIQDESKPCSYWCKTDCHPSGFYCCNYDPANNFNTVIKDPCGAKKECPATEEPRLRDCVDEVSGLKICENNDDCAKDEGCCTDKCLPKDKKVCKDLSGKSKPTEEKENDNTDGKVDKQRPKNTCETKDPKERNCRKEMKNLKECMINDDCEKGYTCCSDPCLNDDKKICRKYGDDTEEQKKACDATKNPKVRNCLLEVSTLKKCTKNTDCDSSELCCPDQCVEDSEKVCRNTEVAAKKKQECPATDPPRKRDCANEMDKATKCTEDADCNTDMICCKDKCLNDDEKICKKV